MENKIDVKQFISTYNLTNKAKFLFKKGFVEETIQVEKIDEYLDVTYNDGFMGYAVYTKDNELFLVKSETNEESKIYSYNVTKLATVTDEEYNQLINIDNEVNKTSLFKVLRVIATVFTILAFVLNALEIVTNILNHGLIVGLAYSAVGVVLVGILLGTTTMLYKKK